MSGFGQLFEILCQTAHLTPEQLQRDGEVMSETNFWLLAQITQLQRTNVLFVPIHKIIPLGFKVDLDLKHQSCIFAHLKFIAIGAYQHRQLFSKFFLLLDRGQKPHSGLVRPERRQQDGTLLLRQLVQFDRHYSLEVLDQIQPVFRVLVLVLKKISSHWSLHGEEGVPEALHRLFSRQEVTSEDLHQQTDDRKFLRESELCNAPEDHRKSARILHLEQN
jgi:hypothetical protein